MQSRCVWSFNVKSAVVRLTGARPPSGCAQGGRDVWRSCGTVRHIAAATRSVRDDHFRQAVINASRTLSTLPLACSSPRQKANRNCSALCVVVIVVVFFRPLNRPRGCARRCIRPCATRFGIEFDDRPSRRIQLAADQRKRCSLRGSEVTLLLGGVSLEKGHADAWRAGRLQICVAVAFSSPRRSRRSSE